LVAAPLVITARQAPLEQQDITIWFEGMGWFTAAAMVWVIAFPGLWLRFMFSFWDAASDPDLLRAIGVLNLAIGLGLGWVAFFVL